MKLQAITNPDHVIEYPQIGNVDSRLVSVIQSCLERDISRQEFQVKYFYIIDVN